MLGDVPAAGRLWRVKPGAANGGDLSLKTEEKDKLAGLAAAADQERQKHAPDLEGRGERALGRDVQNFGELASTNAVVLSDNFAITPNAVFSTYDATAAYRLPSQLGLERKEAQGKPSTSIALPSSTSESSLYARAKSGANEQSRQVADARRTLDEALRSRQNLQMEIASEGIQVNQPESAKPSVAGQALTAPARPSLSQRISSADVLEKRLAEQDQKVASAKKEVEQLQDALNASAGQQSDITPAKPTAPAPVPQPEVQTATMPSPPSR